MSPGGGTPTGSVDFYDGATLLGSGQLDGGGVASFTTSQLAVGDHTMSAAYEGDSNFTSSTSSNLDQEVYPLVGLANPAAPTNADGDTAYLALQGGDSAGNALTYTAANLPPGLSIDPSTGVISGTIETGADADSPYLVTVAATDSVETGIGMSESFEWTVTSAAATTVSLTEPSNQTNLEEDLANLDLSATDSASNSLVYGASGLPAGLTIDPSTGVISGSLADGDSAMSPYTVTVTATDSTNPTVGAGQTFQWVVHPLVTLANPGDSVNADGDSVFVPLSATDSAGNAIDFSATNLPPGLSVDASTGILSGTVSNRGRHWQPICRDGHGHGCRRFERDRDPEFHWSVLSTGTLSVTVTQPANQTKVEEDSVNLSLSATDSAANSLVYSALNLPLGLSIDTSTGIISGTISDGASGGSPIRSWSVPRTAPTPASGPAKPSCGLSTRKLA